MKAEENKLALKSIRNQVFDMIKAAEQRNEAELNRRRARLHHQLLEENRIYEREIQHQLDSYAKEFFDEQLQGLEQAKIHNQLEREEFLKQKKLQQQMNNSIEFRELLSRKQLEGTKQAQIEQIKEKTQRNIYIKMEDQIWHQIEQRTQHQKYLREMSQEREKLERNRNIVETLNKQLENKQVFSTAKKIEAQYERKVLQQKVDDCKTLDQQRKIEKLQEIDHWKKELKRQMECRKLKNEFEHAQNIEHEKQISQLIQQQLDEEKHQMHLSKEKQHLENVEFQNYIEKQRNHLNKIESQPNPFKVCERRHHEMEERAALERQKEKQRLKREQMAAYHDALERKRHEYLAEKKCDAIELAASQKQNAAYNQQRAKEKLQTTLRIRNDLEQQIYEKNHEKISRGGEDAENKRLLDLENAAAGLSQQILTIGLDVTAMKHPFYRRLSDKQK